MLSSWLNQAVTLGGLLVVTLIAARNLEGGELSLWLALNLVLAIGTIVDASLRVSIARSVAWFNSGATELPGYSADSFRSADKADGLPNHAGIALAVLTSRRLVRILTVALLPLIGIAAWHICQNLVKATQIIDQEWIATIIMTIGAVALAGYSGLYTGILQGINRISAINRIQGFVGLLRLSVLCSALLLQMGILELIAITLIFQIAQLFFLKRAAYHAEHGWVKEIGSIKKEGISLNRAIWPGMWRLTAVYLGGFVISQGASMLATQLNDAAQISSFLFTVRLCGAIGTIAIVPLSTYLPQITGLRAEKNVGKIRKLLVRRIALILLSVSVALTLLFTLGNVGLSLVSPRLHIIGGWSALIMCVWIILELHHNMHATAYASINYTPFLLPSLLSGVAILAFGSAVVETHQILGLVLVQFLVQLSFNNWYPVLLNLRSLDWTLGGYLGALHREVRASVVKAARPAAKFCGFSKS